MTHLTEAPPVVDWEMAARLAALEFIACTQVANQALPFDNSVAVVESYFEAMRRSLVEQRFPRALSDEERGEWAVQVNAVAVRLHETAKARLEFIEQVVKRARQRGSVK